MPRERDVSVSSEASVSQSNKSVSVSDSKRSKQKKEKKAKAGKQKRQDAEISRNSQSSRSKTAEPTDEELLNDEQAIRRLRTKVRMEKIEALEQNKEIESKELPVLAEDVEVEEIVLPVRPVPQDEPKPLELPKGYGKERWIKSRARRPQKRVTVDDQYGLTLDDSESDEEFEISITLDMFEEEIEDHRAQRQAKHIERSMEHEREEEIAVERRHERRKSKGWIPDILDKTDALDLAAIRMDEAEEKSLEERLQKDLKKSLKETQMAQKTKKHKGTEWWDIDYRVKCPAQVVNLSRGPTVYHLRLPTEKKAFKLSSRRSGIVYQALLEADQVAATKEKNKKLLKVLKRRWFDLNIKLPSTTRLARRRAMQTQLNGLKKAILQLQKKGAAGSLKGRMHIEDDGTFSFSTSLFSRTRAEQEEYDRKRAKEKARKRKEYMRANRGRPPPKTAYKKYKERRDRFLKLAEEYRSMASDKWDAWVEKKYVELRAKYGGAGLDEDEDLPLPKSNKNYVHQQKYDPKQDKGKWPWVYPHRQTWQEIEHAEPVTEKKKAKLEEQQRELAEKEREEERSKQVWDLEPQSDSDNLSPITTGSDEDTVTDSEEEKVDKRDKTFKTKDLLEFERKYRQTFTRDLKEALPANVMVVPQDALTRFEVPRKFTNRPADPDMRSKMPKPKPRIPPDSINLVVMLHDRTAYSYQFVELGSYLVEQGYAVLDFDFYGRGGSPFPEDRNVECDLDLLVEQTRDLLTYLGAMTDEDNDILPGMKKKIFTFTLVGMDMGGAVAVGFAQRYPRVVEGLVLLAPSGLSHVDVKSAMRDYLTRMFSCLGKSNKTLKSQAGQFHRPDRYPHFQERCEDEVIWQNNNTPGYTQALFSTDVFFPLAGMDAVYKEVGKDPRKVLVLWGKNDKLTPPTQARTLKENMPDADVLLVPSCGHNVVYEGHEFVKKALLRFLHKQLDVRTKEEKRELKALVARQRQEMEDEQAKRAGRLMRDSRRAEKDITQNIVIPGLPPTAVVKEDGTFRFVDHVGEGLPTGSSVKYIHQTETKDDLGNLVDMLLEQASSSSESSDNSEETETDSDVSDEEDQSLEARRRRMRRRALKAQAVKKEVMSEMLKKNEDNSDESHESD